jgi:hypothetical protein
MTTETTTVEYKKTVEYINNNNCGVKLKLTEVKKKTLTSSPPVASLTKRTAVDFIY